MGISTAMSGLRRRGVRALLISGLVTLAVSAPSAAAEPAPTDGQQKTVKKTARVAVDRGEIQEAMSQVKARRADGTVVSLAQESPSCSTTGPDGAPSYWEIEVNWWYDTQTRLTLSSEAFWVGETHCFDMNYISMSSDLSFRNQQVDLGSFGTCGTTSNSNNNHCGQVDSDGIWLCVGVGNCNGDYHASFGWLWVLPGGWGWGGLPPSCVALSDREALCLWSTRTLYVPHLN